MKTYRSHFITESCQEVGFLVFLFFFFLMHLVHRTCYPLPMQGFENARIICCKQQTLGHQPSPATWERHSHKVRRSWRWEAAAPWDTPCSPVIFPAQLLWTFQSVTLEHTGSENSQNSLVVSQKVKHRVTASSLRDTD